MNAPIRIYVPRDAAALAVDADAVARAIEAAAEQRGLAVQLVRNGSRGLLWLEPMVEVATPAGRVAYGPVQPEDVADLFEAGWLQGGAHPLRLGPTEDIPYLKHQERLTFARVGVTDPLSLQDYAAHGGLEGSSARCPWRPRPSSRNSSIPDCAAAAARPSPPASNGRRWPARRPTRNTSSATPTKAIPAPTPTAC